MFFKDTSRALSSFSTSMPTAFRFGILYNIKELVNQIPGDLYGIFDFCIGPKQYAR